MNSNGICKKYKNCNSVIKITRNKRSLPTQLFVRASSFGLGQQLNGLESTIYSGPSVLPSKSILRTHLSQEVLLKKTKTCHRKLRISDSFNSSNSTRIRDLKKGGKKVLPPWRGRNSNWRSNRVKLMLLTVISIKYNSKSIPKESAKKISYVTR